VLVPNDWAGALARAGALAPLPAALAERPDIPDRLRGAMRVDGQTLGVPFLVEAPVLVANAGHARNPPATFAALAAFCRDFRAGEFLVADPRSPCRGLLSRMRRRLCVSPRLPTCGAGAPTAARAALPSSARRPDGANCRTR
jgi:hypothetical protein